MRGLSKVIGASLCIVGLLAQNCDKRVQGPTSVDPNSFPLQPTNLKASIGDGLVVLSWSHTEVASITKFNIYRKDSTTTSFNRIGSSDSLAYLDSNLQNNREYFYEVTAVGNNGLESSKSTTASAVPAVYGIAINFGEEYTTSQNVTLSFTAPMTTSLVKISNDSLFTDSQWETYAPIKNWNVSFEDGEKIVYAKFRDARDRETFEAFSDNIILDTQAVISQVLEDSGGRVLVPDDSIHYTIITDEADGKAWIILSGRNVRVNLFDDGTNGDPVAGDGVYERTARIARGEEVEDALVFGHFIDQAGNIAETLRAPGTVTIRQPPVPVDLISVSPVSSSSTSLNIFWTRNTDEDFANYRIFRSNVPGVDLNSQLVTIIQEQAATSYTDTDLTANTTYYYRVYVFDTTGLSSGSNEENGTTN